MLTTRTKARALLVSGIALAAGATSLTPATAAADVTAAPTTVSGTLRPGASVTVGTRGTVTFCLTNLGPSATATVVLRGTWSERVVVRTRVCNSISTVSRLVVTNASTGVRPSSVRYTVYGATGGPF